MTIDEALDLLPCGHPDQGFNECGRCGVSGTDAEGPDGADYTADDILAHGAEVAPSTWHAVAPGVEVMHGEPWPMPLAWRVSEATRQWWDLEVFVPGKPVTKGSTQAFAIKANNNRGMRAVTTADNSADQRAWVAFIRDQVMGAIPGRPPHVGPVRIDVEFVLPRRKSAPKSWTPAMTRKPDMDKLERAVWDALTTVVWVDDAQVVRSSETKREAGPDETPGARIRVALLTDDDGRATT
jgi:crossover junction endodeoxyribonuclease RusA